MPNHPFVIGIAGFAGSGKSTFAAKLVARLWSSHGLTAQIVPFARPLKDGLAAMGIDKSSHPDLYRVAAQRLGTDIVRSRYPNWWCDRFRESVKSMPVKSVHVSPDGGMRMDRVDVVIADDVRFLNEVATLHVLGGSTVYVDAAERLGMVRRDWKRHKKLRRRGVYKHKSEDLAAAWWLRTWRSSGSHPPYDWHVNANFELETDGAKFELDVMADAICTNISKRLRPAPCEF